MNSEVMKPITVVRSEFINNLTTLINESGLPPFVIEPVLKDMLYNVRIMAQRQLDEDMQAYHEKLAATHEKLSAADEQE